MRCDTGQLIIAVQAWDVKFMLFLCSRLVRVKLQGDRTPRPLSIGRMLTAAPRAQWFGPSWHDAFETVRKAKHACENSRKAEPTEHPMDVIYGKVFLDYLQRSVITGAYKRFPATTPNTHVRKVRSQGRRVKANTITYNVANSACEPGVKVRTRKAPRATVRQSGQSPLGHQEGYRAKHSACKKGGMLPRVQIPVILCTDSMLAFQLRVEE